MMSTALMLCGLSPHLIQTYSEVMGYVKAVSEDLFFFVFMFFACGLFIWDNIIISHAELCFF